MGIGQMTIKKENTIRNFLHLHFAIVIEKALDQRSIDDHHWKGKEERTTSFLPQPQACLNGTENGAVYWIVAIREGLRHRIADSAFLVEPSEQVPNSVNVFG